MRNTLAVAAGLTLLGTVSAAQGGSLDLNMGPDAAQFQVTSEMVSGVSLGGGALYSNYRESSTVLHAQVMGISRTRDREFGVGTRWTQYDTDYGKGGGLGMGAYGDLFLPQLPEVSLGGYAFYTPGVVATRHLEGGYEMGVRARYAFAPHVAGYLGLRQLSADFNRDDGSRRLDRGAHIGVRLRF